MKRETVTGMVRSVGAAGVALVMLAAASTAEAQSREGRWELSLGAAMQLSNDIEGQRGSSLETDDDFGLGGTLAYHLSDRFAASFGFQWFGVDYDGQAFDEDGDLVGISGSYDAWVGSASLVYNLMDGAFTPYLGAGIGWTWIDTNIPSGPPSTGCWWDPWWGWVCYTTYPTAREDAFSYQATVGLRYQVNPSTFVRFGYTSQWLDLDGPTSTPQFDVLAIEIGWMF